MKAFFIILITAVLTGCSERAFVVTVGPDRPRYDGVIRTYDFYAKELVAYFDTLPAERRMGLDSVSALSDQKLRIVVRATEAVSPESTIATLFEVFARERFDRKIQEWKAREAEFLRPVVELAETQPDRFRALALKAFADTQRPTVEVYTLRIENE